MIKKFFATCILLFSILYSSGQTQIELTRESTEEFKRADSNLKIVYNKILKLYSNDKLFIRNLKESEFFWLKYRDAQIKAMFPDYNIKYGSMFSMCVTSYSKELTELRINELQKWLIGRDDADCLSSIKPKNSIKR